MSAREPRGCQGRGASPASVWHDRAHDLVDRCAAPNPSPPSGRDRSRRPGADRLGGGRDRVPALTRAGDRAGAAVGRARPRGALRRRTDRDPSAGAVVGDRARARRAGRIHARRAVPRQGGPSRPRRDGAARPENRGPAAGARPAADPRGAAGRRHHQSRRDREGAAGLGQGFEADGPRGARADDPRRPDAGGRHEERASHRVRDRQPGGPEVRGGRHPILDRRRHADLGPRVRTARGPQPRRPQHLAGKARLEDRTQGEVRRHAEAARARTAVDRVRPHRAGGVGTGRRPGPGRAARPQGARLATPTAGSTSISRCAARSASRGHRP